MVCISNSYVLHLDLSTDPLSNPEVIVEAILGPVDPATVKQRVGSLCIVHAGILCFPRDGNSIPHRILFYEWN